MLVGRKKRSEENFCILLKRAHFFAGIPMGIDAKTILYVIASCVRVIFGSFLSPLICIFCMELCVWLLSWGNFYLDTIAISAFQPINLSRVSKKKIDCIFIRETRVLLSTQFSSVWWLATIRTASAVSRIFCFHNQESQHRINNWNMHGM